MKIYNPQGAVGKPPASLAPAPDSLAGINIGLLANSKPNARELLVAAGNQLARRVGAKLLLCEEKNAALAAPEETLTTLSKETQVVLTGSAD